jgi:hypothetical protein
MNARALGLVLDTVEMLSEGSLRDDVAPVLVDLWERVYGGERLNEATVADASGAMLGVALDVRASGRGGMYPLLCSGPHWRVFLDPWKGRARLILSAEYLARVAGHDARVECERIADWLFGPSVAWRLSRLDVACDVAGVPVSSFADLDTCVTRSHGVAVHYDDGEMEEGSTDVMNARIMHRRREIQTVTFGSASSRIQACIYDKRAETKASGKSWQLDAARERGWDGCSPLTRVEFRWRGRALDEYPELRLRALDALDRADEWMLRLWRYATTESVRFVVPTADSNRSRWLVPTEEWSVVAGIVDERHAVARVRCVSESVRDERMRRASRDHLRGTIVLCAETPSSAHEANNRLAAIIDGLDESEPELVLVASAWATHGDLIGVRVLDVRDRRERARVLQERLKARAKVREWHDDPGLSLSRCA